MKRVIVVLILLFSISAYAYAHSGGTDSKGGHYNRSTGEYHYHHGKPAHQHPGGICPYDRSSPTQAPRSSSPSGTSSDGVDIPDLLVGAGAGSAALYVISKVIGKK